MKAAAKASIPETTMIEVRVTATLYEWKAVAQAIRDGHYHTAADHYARLVVRAVERLTIEAGLDGREIEDQEP